MDGPRQRAAAGEQVLKVAAQSGDNGGGRKGNLKLKADPRGRREG